MLEDAGTDGGVDEGTGTLLEAGTDGTGAGAELEGTLGNDAGTEGTEAGGEDAGTEGIEAGGEDAGTEGIDAGGEDAGGTGTLGVLQGEQSNPTLWMPTLHCS